MNCQDKIQRRVWTACAWLAAILALGGWLLARRNEPTPAGAWHGAVPTTFPPTVGTPPAAVAAPATRPAHEDLARLFPPSELPMVATEEGARTSLRYLAENGADLTRPMPSKHRVFAANAQIASQLADWGRANGFEIRGPVLVRSHVGEPQQSLELVRTEVPDPALVEREGRLILAAVQRTPGTFYQTWCGEIVR